MGEVTHKTMTGDNLHIPQAHASSHVIGGSDPLTGALSATSLNIATLTVGDDLVPTASGTYNSGSTSYPWSLGMFNTEVQTPQIRAQNGTLILGGAYGNNNENITLDFETIANKIVLSSSSGVSTVNCALSWRFNDNKVYDFGSGTDARFTWRTDGTYHCFVTGLECGTDAQSGYWLIMNKDDIANVNRRPTSNVADPHLRIYSSHTATAVDWIEIYHNQTDGYITCGTGTINFGDENLTTTGSMTAGSYHVGASTGWSGSYTNGDGTTVTVVGGIITNVA